MKKLLLASVGIFALGIASASAADIERRVMPAKAPAYVSQMYNWSGAYIGINGGGGWGNSGSGGLIGGTLGYNWQTSPWVFGIETDLDWSNIRNSGTCGAGFSCEARNNWLGTFRGRVGYAWDRVMPYVTGGLAYGGVHQSVAGVGSSNSTKAGWALGGGIEFAIAGPWTAKVEYLHVDLGNDSVLGTSVNYRSDIVRGGLNYRF